MERVTLDLWDVPALGVSATFGMGGISIGVYSASQTLLATLRGPLLGLAGTSPLALRDVDGATVLELTVQRLQVGGARDGRTVAVSRPDGSPLGVIYLRSLTRGVVYGLYDQPSQSDFGWLSSQDPQLQLFRLDDASGGVAGWLHIATEDLHALSDSSQTWNVTLRGALGPRLGPLAVAAMIMPPTLLRNVLSH